MTSKCCNNTDYIKAYTPCYPFKAKLCLNCGEVVGDSGFIVGFLFTYIFSPFWNGAVQVNTEGLTQEQLVKLNNIQNKI